MSSFSICLAGAAWLSLLFAAILHGNDAKLWWVWLLSALLLFGGAAWAL